MARTPEELECERNRWRALERERPPRVPIPGPGQESVWDYPRPPRVEPCEKRVRVEFGGVLLADTRRALRVLETASPPCFYLPPNDVRTELFEETDGTTLCEWKGLARYFSVRVGDSLARDAAWSYPEPFEGFEEIRDSLAFFPARVDACTVDGRRVRPQPGGYYGGWITQEVIGPFKGEPGTERW